MSGKTSIQWATRVWNPTTGCTRVSAGCDNCYAFALHDKRYASNLRATRAASSERWIKPTEQVIDARSAGLPLPYVAQYDRPFSEVQILERRLEEPMRWTRPERVFVDSMSDLFHEAVPEGYIARVFDVMASRRYRRQTAAEKRRDEPREADGPEHQYLILTKRPERMRQVVERMPEFADLYMPGDSALGVSIEVGQWPLPNVWLGVSVEDQAAADSRIPELLRTPAAIRFLSCEPLIGRVTIPFAFDDVRAGLHWVIVGGESGPRARPMDLAWARSLVEQCRWAGVAPFVKQLGRRPVYRVDSEMGRELSAIELQLRDSHGGEPAEWPDDLRVREWPRGYAP